MSSAVAKTAPAAKKTGLAASKKNQGAPKHPGYIEMIKVTCSHVYGLRSTYASLIDGNLNTT